MQCNFFESNDCQRRLGKIRVLVYEGADFPHGAQGAAELSSVLVAVVKSAVTSVPQKAVVVKCYFLQNIKTL